jgi:hypothetical protein
LELVKKLAVVLKISACIHKYYGFSSNSACLKINYQVPAYTKSFIRLICSSLGTIIFVLAAQRPMFSDTNFAVESYILLQHGPLDC